MAGLESPFAARSTTMSGDIRFRAASSKLSESALKLFKGHLKQFLGGTDGRAEDGLNRPDPFDLVVNDALPIGRTVSGLLVAGRIFTRVVHRFALGDFLIPCTITDLLHKVTPGLCQRQGPARVRDRPAVSILYGGNCRPDPTATFLVAEIKSTTPSLGGWWAG